MPLLTIRRRRPPVHPSAPVPTDAPFLPRTVLDEIAPTDVEQRRDALVVENLPAAGLAVTALPRTIVPGWLRGVCDQGLPFDLLELHRRRVERVVGFAMDGFDHVHESVGIPLSLKQVVQRRGRRCAGAERFAGERGDLRQGRVVAAAGVPILGVGEVALAAVHDRVPEAAGGGFHVLRDLV